jgi:outer membrane protein OmpA-like peptidoglycan-associated protein
VTASRSRLRRIRDLAVTALFWAAVGALAAEPPGTPVSFLACPVARDTGPDTDVCFFAEYKGDRYALLNPPDWGVPQLKHRVLVEGHVKEGPPECGATPIEGRASVMTEIDETCNVIVPFDNVIKGVAGGVFNRGTPEQRAYAENLARRAALDPRLSIEPVILDPPRTPPPAPPFNSRTLVITYPFDSDRGPGPDMMKLKELADYALAAKARRVDVIGYRATSRLSDGSEVTEKPAMAEARAKKIAAILDGLGMATRIIDVHWDARAIAGTGDGDWRNRKVEVTVAP